MGQFHVIAADLERTFQIFFSIVQTIERNQGASMIKMGRSRGFVLRERGRKLRFGFSRLVQAEKGNATVQMKNKAIRRDLEGICERFKRSLMITHFQILNAEAIQRRNESRLNGKCAFELLDGLVAMTFFK